MEPMGKLANFSSAAALADPKRETNVENYPLPTYRPLSGVPKLGFNKPQVYTSLTCRTDRLEILKLTRKQIKLNVNCSILLRKAQILWLKNPQEQRHKPSSPFCKTFVTALQTPKP